MPEYKEGELVYAIRRVVEHASGDSPGGVCCEFGDRLIVRREYDPTSKTFGVSHEDRTDGITFLVFKDEISSMKHFDHNDPRTTWSDYLRSIRDGDDAYQPWKS